MSGGSSKHDNLESILQDQALKPHALPLRYLQEITKNFCDERVVGKGGAGVVYKGVLQSGETIAVKRLVPSMMGAQTLFENEVYRLMKLKHPNIVRFIGYCYETQNIYLEYKGKDIFAERSEMLLCLEYLPKGSLDGYLSDGFSDLDWHTCYKIIEGISYGSHYLHEQFDKSILHLDLKSANVLLDDNMTPKITDFGLSRLLDEKQTIFTPNRVGTLGYMAPEYIDEGVTGTSCEGFIEFALKKWRNTLEKAQGYRSLEIDCQQIKRCIRVGLMCLNPEWTERPTATKIIKMLQALESTDCSISNELTSLADQAEQLLMIGCTLGMDLSPGRSGFAYTKCFYTSLHLIMFSFLDHINRKMIKLLCPVVFGWTYLKETHNTEGRG